MKGPASRTESWSDRHLLPRLCGKGNSNTKQGHVQRIFCQEPLRYIVSSKKYESQMREKGKVAIHAHGIKIDLAVLYFFKQAAFTCLFGKPVLFWGEILVFLAGGVMTPLWVAFITNSYQLFCPCSTDSRWGQLRGGLVTPSLHLMEGTGRRVLGNKGCGMTESCPRRQN